MVVDGLDPTSAEICIPPFFHCKDSFCVESPVLERNMQGLRMLCMHALYAGNRSLARVHYSLSNCALQSSHPRHVLQLYRTEYHAVDVTYRMYGNTETSHILIYRKYTTPKFLCYTVPIIWHFRTQWPP